MVKIHVPSGESCASWMQLIDAAEAVGCGRSELVVLGSKSEPLSESESSSSLELGEISEAACS